MLKPIITFKDTETSLSEERKELIKEIVEVLALAEKKQPLTTKVATEVFLENQDKALKKAQNLFNQLKETYTVDIEAKMNEGSKPDASTLVPVTP